MGKKINPKIFRLGQTRTWDSRWFAVKNYGQLLKQDIEIKKYLMKSLAGSFVSRIEIERTQKGINVIIRAARPGVIIGRGGVGIDDLRKEISRRFVKNKNIVVKVNILEVKDVNLDARVVAVGVKLDIEKRMPFRRAMKQALMKAEKAGAKGIKIQISGRLNGADIARREKLLSGSVPLHTLRADIDYAAVEANTLYGAIGIKVWIYRGDIFAKKKNEQEEE